MKQWTRVIVSYKLNPGAFKERVNEALNDESGQKAYNLAKKFKEYDENGYNIKEPKEIKEIYNKIIDKAIDTNHSYDLIKNNIIIDDEELFNKAIKKMIINYNLFGDEDLYDLYYMRILHKNDNEELYNEFINTMIDRGEANVGLLDKLITKEDGELFNKAKKSINENQYGVYSLIINKIITREDGEIFNKIINKAINTKDITSSAIRELLNNNIITKEDGEIYNKLKNLLNIEESNKKQAKWKLKSSLRKRADELDDLNTQILELQKRKQEIENQRRQQREEEEKQNSLKQNAAKAKELMMNLVYQVNNGGVQQYCMNGYADELLGMSKEFDIIETLKSTGCPEDGIKAMQRMISDLEDNEPLVTCDYCGGEGFYDEEVEEVDEETGENYTDIEQKRCDECDGEGYITVSTYENGSEDVTGWMEAYDKWFYALKGMNELDDWTEQSHTHSVILDMMKNNKGE